MSATILAFPGTAPVGAALSPANPGPFATHVGTLSKPGPLATQFPQLSATALATRFTDHFLPVVQASVDLLEADEADFEDRCRRMADADGTAMIDELCAELRTVGEQMQILVDGLELTRARLRTAMARLADKRVTS